MLQIWLNLLFFFGFFLEKLKSQCVIICEFYESEEVCNELNSTCTWDILYDVCTSINDTNYNFSSISHGYRDYDLVRGGCMTQDFIIGDVSVIVGGNLEPYFGDTPSTTDSFTSTFSETTTSPTPSRLTTFVPTPSPLPNLSTTPSPTPSPTLPTLSPTTSSPTTSSPTTLSPTPSPTTSSPTTLSPTPSPTTLSPTPSPTTLSPTTRSPTPSPTTLSPTPSPTTLSPTTRSPTLSPTTLSPTTRSPTPSPTTLSPTPSPTSAPTFVTFPQGITTTLLPTITPTPSPTISSPTIKPTKKPTSWWSNGGGNSWKSNDDNDDNRRRRRRTRRRMLQEDIPSNSTIPFSINFTKSCIQAVDDDSGGALRQVEPEADEYHLRYAHSSDNTGIIELLLNDTNNTEINSNLTSMNDNNNNNNRRRLLAKGVSTKAKSRASVSSTIWSYSFFEDSWQKLSDFIDERIKNPCITTDFNNNIYIIGGFNYTTWEASNVLWIYNTINNSFINHSYGNLNIARNKLSCIYHDGKIAVFGGTNTGGHIDQEDIIYNSIEILKIDNNYGWNNNFSNDSSNHNLLTVDRRVKRSTQWRLLKYVKLSQCRVESKSIIMGNYDIWIIGGWNGSNAIQQIDIFNIHDERICKGPLLYDGRCSPALRKEIYPYNNQTCLEVIGGCQQCRNDLSSQIRLSDVEYFCFPSNFYSF